jgi:general nucleoside transport system permease protein
MTTTNSSSELSSREATRRAALLRRIQRLAGLTVALLLAFEVLVVLSGDNPLSALSRAAAGTWGTAYGAGQVLFKATPLLFSGLAFETARRAGLFNIGVEGQAAIASLACASVAARLPAWCPAFVAVPLALAAAMFAGAAFASIAGFLRVRAGAHEVITTIMSNRIAEALVGLLLAHGLGVTDYRTPDIRPAARLTRLSVYVHSFSGSAASVAVFFAIATAFAVVWWFRRTVAGRETTWVGSSPDACRAAGVPVDRRLLGAMALSGGLAGLVASATVLGYKGYYEAGLGAGAGFSGIAVALLGGRRPMGYVLAALFLGTLQQAGLVLNATVPKESMDVLAGVAILLVAAGTSTRLAGGSSAQAAP